MLVADNTELLCPLMKFSDNSGFIRFLSSKSKQIFPCLNTGNCTRKLFRHLGTFRTLTMTWTFVTTRTIPCQSYAGNLNLFDGQPKNYLPSATTNRQMLP